MLRKTHQALAVLQGFPSTPTTVDGVATAAAGVSHKPALEDHQHDLDVSGTPGEVGTASAQGAGPGSSLNAHTHRLGIMTTSGDLLTFVAGNPTRLPIGAFGRFLASAGTAVFWADLTPTIDETMLIGMLGWTMGG